METNPQAPQLKTFVENLNLYVEIETSRLYETKLFEEFVLARPILPQFYNHVKKIPLEEFGKQFEDYTGDRSTISKFISRYHPEPVEA